MIKFLILIDLFLGLAVAGCTGKTALPSDVPADVSSESQPSGDTSTHPSGGGQIVKNGVKQAIDLSVLPPSVDPDQDNVPSVPVPGIDKIDNCPDVFNPTQEDTDGDGIGDACDPTPNGGV